MNLLLLFSFFALASLLQVNSLTQKGSSALFKRYERKETYKYGNANPIEYNKPSTPYLKEKVNYYKPPVPYMPPPKYPQYGNTNVWATTAQQASKKSQEQPADLVKTTVHVKTSEASKSSSSFDSSSNADSDSTTITSPGFATTFGSSSNSGSNSNSNSFSNSQSGSVSVNTTPSGSVSTNGGQGSFSSAESVASSAKSKKMSPVHSLIQISNVIAFLFFLILIH